MTQEKQNIFKKGMKAIIKAVFPEDDNTVSHFVYTEEEKKLLEKKDSPEVVSKLHDSLAFYLIQAIKEEGRPSDFDKGLPHSCIVKDIKVSIDGKVFSHKKYDGNIFAQRNKLIYRIPKDHVVYVKDAIETRYEQLRKAELERLEKKRRIIEEEFLARKNSPEVAAALKQSGVASLIERIEKHGKYDNSFFNRSCIVDDELIHSNGDVHSVSSRKKLYSIPKDQLIYVNHAIKQRFKQLAEERKSKEVAQNSVNLSEQKLQRNKER